jgi:glycine betaine/choline ABC-type transport system substrate-binding protein
VQKLVKHSQEKDQFLKVAIKQMTETQILEDVLKEVGEHNSVLLTEKQELEAKLAKERRVKDGNHFPDSLFS